MGNSYTNALARLKEQLKPISEEYKKPVMFFWIDAMISYVRYGVTPNEYVGFQFYKKSALEKSRFYTARHSRRYEKLLNAPEHYDLFWDKAKFNAIFSDFVHRDWLLCESGGLEIENFLSSHNKVLVKPTDKSSSKGIHVYAGETAEQLIQSQCLLEEFVVQHHLISELNPSSVNTIRMYTMLDSRGEPHVLTATLRVGGKNAEVDNFHSGGVGYPIEIETGIIKGAGADIMGRRFLFHPSTGVKVIGFQIPNWEGLLRFVYSACRVLPRARLIAWDVAVLENGFEMIKGNYDGDPGLLQTPSGEGQRTKILAFK